MNERLRMLVIVDVNNIESDQREVKAKNGY